jgi:hypothetical protein
MIPVRRALRTRGAERLPPRTWENSLNSAGDLPISSNIFTQLPCLHRSRWLFTVPLCTGDPTKPTAKPTGHHRFYAWGWFTNLKCLVTKVVISHNPCLAMSILKTLNWHWSNVVQLSRRVTCWGEPVLQLASLCQQLSRVLRHSTTQFEEGLILNHWQLLATSIILNHSESEIKEYEFMDVALSSTVPGTPNSIWNLPRLGRRRPRAPEIWGNRGNLTSSSTLKIL